MSNQNPFETFDFSPRRRFPRLVAIEAIALIGLLVLWSAAPGTLFICLLLPLVAVLIWIASFGWRQALSRFIEFLQSLDASGGLW
jgi:hypothetical protein